MKPTLGRGLAALLSLASLASLSACMNTPAPLEPENTEDDSSGGSGKKKNPDALSPDDTSGSSPLGDGTTTHTSPRGEHATIKDDSEKTAKACSGASIPDLLSVVSQTSCEVPKATPDNESQKDVKDSLEVKATADVPKVAPGGRVTFTVTLHNKGKADLALDFVADPEPRFDLEVYTLKGSRAENPPGAEPALPSSVSDQAAPDKAISRVTLPPGGTATLVVPWEAVKYKWAPADRAKGALPGSHYPRDVAGPLAKGKYAVKIVMPLVGVAEGSDHEYSQPRVPVEVH